MLFKQYRFTFLYIHSYNNKEEMININITVADRFSILLLGQGQPLLHAVRSKWQDRPALRLKSDFGTDCISVTRRGQRPFNNLLLSKMIVPLPEIYPHPECTGFFNELVHITTWQQLFSSALASCLLSEIHHLTVVSDKQKSWHERGRRGHKSLQLEARTLISAAETAQICSV